MAIPPDYLDLERHYQKTLGKISPPPTEEKKDKFTGKAFGQSAIQLAKIARARFGDLTNNVRLNVQKAWNDKNLEDEYAEQITSEEKFAGTAFFCSRCLDREINICMPELDIPFVLTHEKPTICVRKNPKRKYSIIPGNTEIYFDGVNISFKSMRASENHVCKQRLAYINHKLIIEDIEVQKGKN